MMTTHKRNRSVGITLGISAIAMAVLLTTDGAVAQVKTSKKRKVVVEEIIEPAAPAPVKQRTVSLSFKQLGAWSAVNLKGVDGSRTLSFPIRADEMVVGASLKLNYDYSPALIPELSHLRILLNERVAKVLPLPQGKNLGNAVDIELDPRQFTDLNFLRFNLIGHYTRQCEDPFHSSLWLTLSDLGRLELTLASKAVVNDLKYLPAPFIDRRDNQAIKLPFVFVNKPSLGTIKAAGIVASWFGIQAGARGAQFPVSMNALPDGNAVVFLLSTEKIPGLDSPAGPTVSVVTHPTNPSAKLLVITGATEEELLRSARAVALISSTLTGPSVTIAKETAATARQPYDAPAWVPTHRPVRFGELAKPEELRSQGWYPEVIRLNYRVPPDIFTWRTAGVPVQLKYRYTRLPEHKNSSLNVSLNNEFIHALPLNYPYQAPNDANRLNLAGSENISKHNDLLLLPPYAIGGRDQLQLSYFFDVLKHGECQNMPPDNLQGSIDSESTLDFSSFPHYAALPNLSYFSSLGFPFTRMADLSETAVVLPDHPDTNELGLYLTLMGHLGESTGYPVLRHTPLAAANIDSMPDADFLVIGSANSQTLMTKWADQLPIVATNGERRVREPDATWLPAYRWEGKDVHAVEQSKGDLMVLGQGNLSTVMAFESPLKKGRSVVFFHADKSGDLQKITDVFADRERIASVKGDLAVVQDKEVNHTKVSRTYYVGELALKSRLQWLLADYPLWSGFFVVLGSILMAAAAYQPVRRLINRYRKK